MFILNAEIEIGSYVFRAIHEVEITKSLEEMSDSAIIKLPTRFKVRQDSGQRFTEEAIKVGDPVKVNLGYSGKYFGGEFTGFVKKISPKVPMEIHCEDASWLLRRKNITKSWGETTLKEILQEVVKGTPVKLAPNIPEIKLDKWIIKNANGAQVLESIKSNLLMTVFINDQGELYCGLAQMTNIHQEAEYDLNYNLVENNLEFKTSEDRRIKVKYTYIDPKNKKTTIEVGDTDGEERSFHTSVISDTAKLKQMAAAELERLKYDGFEGDVTSFLLPYATRGMAAKVIDQKHPNRQGRYLIKKVVTTFGMSGARRKVTLGNKL